MVAQPDVSSAVDEFMDGLVKRNPGEEEFHQAVREVADSVMPFVLEHPEYADAQAGFKHVADAMLAYGVV